MITDTLQPRRELLREEFVLVQAWKKTATYIRYHNWFSDTLALDRAAVNLPRFLADLRERLRSPGRWQSNPLRIILAPKSQRWTVDSESNKWEPTEKRAAAARLRPLAHVDLAEQVLTTALMLCLADRVETLQGDPRLSTKSEHSRKRVVSYGNRLFCDATNGELRHRWGSAKLYRAYFRDYRTFLERPELVADALVAANEKRVLVVHADIRQFYDRVHPDSLAAAIDRTRRDGDDPEFFDLMKSVLNWGWHQRDQGEVSTYVKEAQLDDFERVALPQGLVAAGFFANVMLLSFDDELRRTIGTEIVPGIQLADACRYVDDLRVTVIVGPQADGTAEHVKTAVNTWLHRLLRQQAPGLQLSAEKLTVTALGDDESPLVRQSARMKRLQTAVSGGFDALGGAEILDTIQSLIRAQETLSLVDDSGWQLTPVPDVLDETVARFAAARFRTTFRSIRPLLNDPGGPEDTEGGSIRPTEAIRTARTQTELDEDARAFALSLIQRWVQNPSNVRLLRIGLDLWPDTEVLREVLGLLRPFTEKRGARMAPRRVAWYCLSEILRAGATETGFVADNESLPAAIDLASYRKTLHEEAARLVQLPARKIPWYLRQQALLFLAAYSPADAPVTRMGRATETRHYRELIRFLRGDRAQLHSPDFATLAVLARRAFVDRETAIQLTQPGLNPARRREIADRDPSFTLELLDAHPSLFDDLPARAREDLSRDVPPPSGDLESLAHIVRVEHPTGPLRNELGLLRFTVAFLREWQEQDSPPPVITPGQVQLRRTKDADISKVRNVRFLRGRADPPGSLYETPEWCEDGDRWRFQLGFLLRFILSGQPDFTRPVRPAHWKENESTYRSVTSHWYQRLYGLFSGQSAFGDNWLPITDWMESFLLALLRWPGCSAPPPAFEWVEQEVDKAIPRIEDRIRELDRMRGPATKALLLPLVVKRPASTRSTRTLCACVVQTAIPNAGDFLSDLTVSEPEIRSRHRNHLSAALAAVERMLALRNTHTETAEHLDWLILPELAVHPNDVRTHLIPFARAHRTIILTGLTYERIAADQALFNSAMWIIPEWSHAYGLQVRTLRQGKKYLAPDEKALNSDSSQLQGFRPCQWLVGYPWSAEDGARPVWLTAAVCYDATDLGLAADLREMSDVFAIPALNKDVKTFDKMALALHYHMYQLVVVVNNGEYGGSNAYWPKIKDYKRQLFHIHGQPQASIAFFNIENIGDFLSQRDQSVAQLNQWKHPPAGFRQP